MQTAEFEIDLSGDQPTIIVNGIDVTTQVRAWTVTGQSGDVPKLFLESPTLDGNVLGSGVVNIIRPGTPDASLVVRSLDPKMVEQEALNRQGFGEDKSLVEIVLDVISEALDAAES